ncbi:MAG TPA: hypothetical protein VMT54_08625 [Candidatus Cybelea sp.]|nr:hypothetical protein [Candidatus Cybelea sp.]
MKKLRWAAIWPLSLLAATACTPWDEYAAGQSQKYAGSPLFVMYEEWGTPIGRVRSVTGERFYQFRKPATGCGASVWTNDLDIILRVAVSGPSACAARS